MLTKVLHRDDDEQSDVGAVWELERRLRLFFLLTLPADSSCLNPSSLCQTNLIQKGDYVLSFGGRRERGKKPKGKNTWRVCLSYQRQTESLETYTYLPARELPASDKRYSPQVWWEGVWRKEVELERGRKGEETPREGKRSGTRGGL